jgi:hypothetical protein
MVNYKKFKIRDSNLQDSKGIQDYRFVIPNSK